MNFQASSSEVKVTEWAFESIRETFERVAKEEAGRLSIVQRIMLRSTDYLRRIIAPTGGKEVSRCHICVQSAAEVGFRCKEALQLVVRDLWRKMIEERPRSTVQSKALQQHFVREAEKESRRA